MPDASSFPANKVDWNFEPQRAVLLIHDMQRYFLSFYPDGCPLVEQLITSIASIKAFCRQKGIQTVYTAQPITQSPEDRGLLNDMWGRGIDNRPELRDIESRLAPDADDIVLTKWRYSAFHKSPLEQLLHDSGKDQLVICGVYGHIGCLMTAANAFMLNIKAFVVGDAIADFSLDDHRLTLNYAANRCGKVISTGDLT